MTVKEACRRATNQTNFSNWIIYVTVKVKEIRYNETYHFSNWIIYVTVKDETREKVHHEILVTE